MTDSKRNRAKQFLNKVKDMSTKHLYMSANKPSNTLAIGGASNKFKRNPNIIYVPKYRLVGTYDDVLDILEHHELDTNLGKYYTVDNYKGAMKQYYTDEVEARRLYQEDLRRSDQEAVLDLISNIEYCRIRLPSIFDRRSKTRNSRKTSRVSKSIPERDENEHEHENDEDTVSIAGDQYDDNVSVQSANEDSIHNEENEEEEEFSTKGTVTRDVVQELQSIDNTDSEQYEDEDSIEQEIEGVTHTNKQQEEGDIDELSEEIVEESIVEEYNGSVLEDVRINRPRSPKKYPSSRKSPKRTDNGIVESKRTRLVPISQKTSTRSTSVGQDSTSTRTRLAPIVKDTANQDSSESTRTRLAPIVNTVPKSKGLNEESSTRRRLRPIEQ